MWSVSGHQVGKKFLTHNMRSIILSHDPGHLGQCFGFDRASGDILWEVLLLSMTLRIYSRYYFHTLIKMKLENLQSLNRNMNLEFMNLSQTFLNLFIYFYQWDSELIMVWNNILEILRDTIGFWVYESDE